MYGAKFKKFMIAMFALLSLALCGAAFAEDEEESFDAFGRKLIAEDIEMSDLNAMAEIIAALGLKWDPNDPSTWPYIDYSEEGYETGGCVGLDWNIDGEQLHVTDLRFGKGDGAKGVLDVSGLSRLKTVIVDPDAGITEVKVEDGQEIEHIEAPGRDKYHEGDVAALKALIEPLGKDVNDWEGFLGEQPSEWSYRRLGNDVFAGFVRWSAAMPMRVEGLHVFELLKHYPEERWPERLDLTRFDALRYLDIAATKFKAVDASNCSALEEIDAIYASDLEELKINGCESLRKVNCCDTKITAIDASGAQNIELFVAADGIGIPKGMKGTDIYEHERAQTIAYRVVLMAQLLDLDSFEDLTDAEISKMLIEDPELVVFTTGFSSISKAADPERYDLAVKKWKEREGYDDVEVAFGGRIGGVTKRVAARAAGMIFGRKVAITGMNDDGFILVDGLGDPGVEARVEGIESRGDGTSVITGSILNSFEEEEVTGTFEIIIRESEDAYRGVEVIGYKRAMGQA